MNYPLRAIPRSCLAGAALLVLSAAGLTGRDAAAQSTSGQPVTADACMEQWDQSGAKNTCSNAVISVQAGQCRIEASCYYWHNPVNHGNKDNNGTYSLADVASLMNCDGSLTVGNCPGPSWHQGAGHGGTQTPGSQ